MTLEHFFTTAEMSCGLSTPPRVEELVAVLKKEKDRIVNNGDDAARQWCSLAHVIAATEDKDCLSLFAKLDGLRYLGWWMERALTIYDCDHLVFESITKVLHAFEKFEIEKEKLLSTGIWGAVKSLLSHKSSEVQRRARTLFDSWNLTKDADAAEEATTACESTLKVGDEPADAGVALSTVQSPQSMLDKESELLPSPGLDVRARPSAELLESTQIPDNQISLQITSDNGNDRHISSDTTGSTVMISFVKTISRGTWKDRSSEDGELGNGEGEPDFIEARLPADSNVQIDKTEYAGDRMHNSLSEPDDFPMAGTSGELPGKPTEGTNGGDNGNSSIGGLAILTPNVSSGLVDVEVPQNGASASECNSPGKYEVHHVNLSQDSHGDGSERSMERSDEVGTSSLVREDIETINNVKKCKKVGRRRSTRASRYTRPAKGSTSLTNKVSDMDLEYCTVDALEIACLVANEVVREVGDYDEQSGSSSSERSFSDASQLRDGSDFVDGKQDDLSEAEEVRTVEIVSADTTAKPDHPVLSRSGIGTGLQYCVQDLNASHATVTAREAGSNSFKSMLAGFDLNQNFSNDDQMLSSDDYQGEVFIGNQSVEASLNDYQASFPVVGSVAAACVLSGLSDSRHEWKESASTSDADGAPLMVDACRRPMRMMYPHIDLNADDFVDDVVELTTKDQVQRSPGTCNGGSSIELNLPPAEMPEFDLNKSNEVVNDAPHLRLTNMHEFNFDLNDDPTIFEDSLCRQSCLGETSTHKASTDGALSDDSDIIFMGTRINKTSLISPPYWNSGLQLSSATDFLYTPSPIYGNNSHAFPPNGTFSPGLHGLSGTIPLVGSGGFPMVPHMMSPVQIVPASYPQPSLFTNMAGFLPVPAGNVPRDLSLELNSGFFSNRIAQDSGAQQQVPAPVMGRPLERTFLSLGKRNEPEGGFTTYPDPYRLDLHL